MAESIHFRRYAALHGDARYFVSPIAELMRYRPHGIALQTPMARVLLTVIGPFSPSGPVWRTVVLMRFHRGTVNQGLA